MTIELSWPFVVASLVTLGAIVWAATRPVQRGGLIPDIAPLLFAGLALIVTLAAWLGYFAWRVFAGA